MFDIFGNFNSAAELNATAEGLKAEGDIESILKLAKENGIDEADAQDYADGYVDCFSNPLMAAMGKLDVEAAELKPCEIMLDWISYIKSECFGKMQMQTAVRSKNKSLNECFAKVLKWSFEHQYPVPQELIKAAGVNAGKVTLGIPGSATVKDIIKKYYLGA